MECRKAKTIIKITINLNNGTYFYQGDFATILSIRQAISIDQQRKYYEKKAVVRGLKVR